MNDTATNTDTAMRIRITDTGDVDNDGNFRSYIATHEPSGVDKEVWQMCQLTGRTVTMGKVIGEIIPERTNSSPRVD